MPLSWSDLLDELRRADLLLSAPAQGPAVTGFDVDSRTICPGGALPGGPRLAVGRSPVRGRCGPPGRGRHRGRDSAAGGGARDRRPRRAPGGARAGERMVRSSRPAALAHRRHRHEREDHHHRAHPPPVQRRGTAGSIGTLGAFDGRGEAVPSTAGSLTTPGPIDLQATLAALVARGVTQVAMETSSHSLDQGRLDGLSFAAGGVHQPDPGPPRLPRHDGGVPGGQAPAEHSAGSEWGRGGEPGR